MLKALYELAQIEELVPDPDFEVKPIAWLVHLDPEGRLLGIQGTHWVPPAEEGKKKPKAVAKSFRVPRESGRTSGARAFFLYDKAEYVFGLDPEPDERKRRPPEKLKERVDLFREKVQACLAATGDEGVRAVATFLGDLAAGRQRVELPEGCTLSDLFSFVYAPDIDRLVTEREKVRAYWKGLRNTPGTDGPGRHHCLISGQPCQPTKLFPLLKRVPGGTSSGVALVSFNASAFESYGWANNENAPIAREAAEACATALNRLLDPAPPNPQDPEQTLPRRNLRLSADTVVCYWASQREDPFLSALPGLVEAETDKVPNLYRSIWRGRAPAIEDPAAFYALTLTGTQGRAIVRDWYESTIGQVAAHLARFFADLDIVRNTPRPREHDLPPQLPLRILLEALAPLGKQEEIPAPLAGEVVRAALTGTPLPLSLLQRCLERMRAEIGHTEWADLERRDARTALLKATLNRHFRLTQQTQSDKEVQCAMDPTNTNPGYLLGRLMAIMERMQQLALGSEVNASVVDRFFSGASATPAAVFPRLMKNLRHHARKAKDDEQTAGAARWLESQVDEVMAQLDGFAPFLPLEEQGLFMIGYHHERHWLWMKKEDREAATAAAAR